MTTTQTGSGNGAAPDGVSERVVPTVAGRWYAQWAHEEPSDDGSLIVWVREEGGRLFVHLGGVTSDLRAFRWLAPIPGPEVCAAMARYVEALVILDDSTRLASDVLGVGNRATVGQAIQNHDLSKARLFDAIRAERDGAA